MRNSSAIEHLDSSIDLEQKEDQLNEKVVANERCGAGHGMAPCEGRRYVLDVHLDYCIDA